MAFFLEEPMLELEKYVQKEIKIERVNFGCVDLKIVQDLVESLEKMLVLYPEIKPFIHAIGTRPFLQKCIDEIEIKMKEEATLEELTQMRQYLVQKESSNNPMMLFHSYMDQGQPCIMFGLEPYLEDCTHQELITTIKDIKKRNSITTVYNPSVIMYHEFGHCLDFLLSVSYDTEIFCAMMQKGIDPERYWYTGSELYADAFAEYYANPNADPICNKVVQYTNRQYHRRFVRK